MLGGPDVAVSDLAAVNTEQESNGGKILQNVLYCPLVKVSGRTTSSVSVGVQGEFASLG